MDPQLFKAYQDFVVGYIAKTVDEATATAFQAESDAWLTSNVPPTNPSTGLADQNASPSVSASEIAMAEQIKASADEIAKLKSDLQDKDFNEFLAKQTNLTPVMANKIKPLLKATADYDLASKSPLQFSEGDKTVKATATELLKAVIKDIPSVVDFNEKIQAAQTVNSNNGILNYSENSQELHTKVINFIASQKTAGKEITYSEAVKLVAGGNL